jgi:hypothetical protein
MKLYSISHDGSEIDWSLFEPEIRRGLGALPRPAVAPGRPGVGFVIAHHGRTADYLVMAWWDRENELPLRVSVRGSDPGSGFHPARDGESICVWDLELIWLERQAYVATVLGESPAESTAYYLARHPIPPAPAPAGNGPALPRVPKRGRPSIH